MKVILVYPDLERYKAPRLGAAPYTGEENYGISCLSAALKNAGHSTSLLHIFQPVGKEQILGRLARLIAGEDKVLVGFSSSTNQFVYAKEWSRWIKDEYGLPVICGGIHATLCSQEVISLSSIDAICIGEGDEAIVEFCNLLQEGKDTTGVRNFWVKKQGRIYKNPVRPLISDLDTLPFPNKYMFDYPKLESVRIGTAGFMASRGCPFNCTYCCNHALKDIYGRPKNYVRFKSPDYILAEIDAVLKDYPTIEKIFFEDDILPLKKDWFEEFAHKYPKKVGLPFGCNCHPNLANPTVAGLLKEAGCKWVHLGLESGNDKIRRQILGRNISNEQIIEACRMFKEMDISVFTYNMVGIPFEDERAILDTVKCNARAKVDALSASVLYPYARTSIHELCGKEGLLTSQTSTSYFRESIIAHPYLSQRQIKAYRQLFGFLVRLYSSTMGLPDKISRASIFFLDLLFAKKWFLLTAKCLSDVANLLFYLPLRLAYRNVFRRFKCVAMLRARIRNYFYGYNAIWTSHSKSKDSQTTTGSKK